MRSLLRGLAGAALVAGLATLGIGPGGLAAQDKKKDAKTPAAPPVVKKDDPKAKDDTRDKTVGISTSDGLSLNAYWFQGNAIDKNPPDAVLMFPAPGNKVTDAWIGLAKALSEKNFSVLLFDWRGCGMNAADTAGQRILADKELFWREMYNKQLLKPQRPYEEKGLDFQRIIGKTEGVYRYRDFLFNDLLAARFYLDRQNDNKKCNSGRIWIVTEKDGGQMGLAFIASEFARNAIYDPMGNIGATGKQFRSGGKDFVGMTVLSYGSGPSSGAASAVFNNAMREMSGTAARDAHDHLEHRLAMILVHGKKEGPGGSKSALDRVQAGGDEEALKKNYKYLREIDNSKAAKLVGGIDLIDPMDTYGVQKLVVDTMIGVSKALPGNKEPLDREANKMTIIPRFPADRLGRR
jgi:hypothetical protein